MKQTFLLVFLIAMLTICNAQSQSKTTKGTSTAKSNVPAQPIVIADRIDTIQVETLMYKGDTVNHIVKFCSPGYYIRQGKVRTADDGKQYWCDDKGNFTQGPARLLGALDDKKQPVKPIIY